MYMLVLRIARYGIERTNRVLMFIINIHVTFIASVKKNFDNVTYPRDKVSLETVLSAVFLFLSSLKTDVC